MVLATVDYDEDWWIQVIKAIIIFAVALQLVPVVLLAERKLLGRFQNRYGPNRVGPFGALQPLADILKLLTKEQFRPTTSVGFLFALAPMISILTAVAAFAIIPFGDTQNIFGTEVGLYGIDVSIGPLYLFAFGAIAFYGIMLGGWSSGSKYSFLGAMRGAAQLISYEVSQGLALVGVIITAQTLSLTGIVHAQTGMWYIVPQFFGFLIFLIAGFAETNRAPVRPDRGRRRAGRRLQHRVRRRALRLLLLRRVPQRAGRLRHRHDRLPRRLAAAVRDPPARLGRPVRRARQDGARHVPVHLGARHAAAPALRPADELRLEGAAAAGHAQRAGHGDRRGGDALMAEAPSNPGSERPPATAPGAAAGARAAAATGALPERLGDWSPGEDVIEVERTPAPGAARGTWRTFRETARGLMTTFGRSSRAPPRSSTRRRRCRCTRAFAGATSCTASRTPPRLEKCVGCSLCAAACPADCIRVVAAENTPENRVSAGERYAAVYEINLARCIFCGYCEVACPFDAITMGHDYELSDYDRDDLIFTKEMLLAEPLERTPLRNEDE